MVMKTKITLFTVLFLIINIIFLAAPVTFAIQVQQPPKLKADAPTAIQLAEDSPAIYVDLYDIYDEEVGSLSFTLWIGFKWAATFDNDIFKATLKSNDTLEIIPIENMFGIDTLTINATNSFSLSTEHNLTITITPVNDPPVIEMIGNIMVTGISGIKIFVYQNEWFNATVKASDVDGDTLVFLDNATLFDINYLTGNISFKPTQTEVGNFFVNITVSDINGSNCEDSVDVLFTVLNVNDPPTAVINNPENGSILYVEEYNVFIGEGEDPDLPFGDKLSFSWSSNIDGFLGESSELEVNYMSPGEHQITLNVKDVGGLFDEATITVIVKWSRWDPLYNIELYSEDSALILRQAEMGSRELMVYNYGPGKDNISFEIKKNMGFNGSVELEFDNVTLRSMTSTSFQVNITASQECKIGFYPIEICSKSSLNKRDNNTDDNNGSSGGKKDNSNKYPYDDYTYGYEGRITIRVYVISNDPKDNDKQADMPTWEVGYQWDYTAPSGYDVPYSNIMNGTMTMEITNEATVDVNDNDYEVYVMRVQSDMDIEMTDPNYGMGDIDVNLSGVGYFRKSDLATVMHEMKYEYTMKMFGETNSYGNKIKTTHDPPLDDYDFPIKPGEQWIVETKIREESSNMYSENGYDKSYTDSRTETNRETISYICLGTESLTTPAGTFETFLITEFERKSEYVYDWEDDSRGSRTRQIYDESSSEFAIDYYSPEVGYTVKQVSYGIMYDYDYINNTELIEWKETFAIELLSYSLESSTVEPEPFTNTTTDSDDDGIPDIWEETYGVDDPKDDFDNDGFSNLDEYQKGTDPTNSNDNPDEPIDSDADGLPDSWERNFGLDPNDPSDADTDLDNDNFPNLNEYNSLTSPINPDEFPEETDDSDSGAQSDIDTNTIDGIGMLYILVFLSILIILILFALAYRRRKKGHRARYPYGEEFRLPSPVAAPGRGPDSPGTESIQQSPETTKPPEKYDPNRPNQPRNPNEPTYNYYNAPPAPRATEYPRQPHQPEPAKQYQHNAPGTPGYNPPPQYNPPPTYTSNRIRNP
jgi:hypothetical protein